MQCKKAAPMWVEINLDNIKFNLKNIKYIKGRYQSLCSIKS